MSSKSSKMFKVYQDILIFIAKEGLDMSNFPTSQPPVDEVTWSGRSIRSRSRNGKKADSIHLNPLEKVLSFKLQPSLHAIKLQGLLYSDLH